MQGRIQSPSELLMFAQGWALFSLPRRSRLPALAAREQQQSPLEGPREGTGGQQQRDSLLGGTEERLVEIAGAPPPGDFSKSLQCQEFEERQSKDSPILKTEMPGGLSHFSCRPWPLLPEGLPRVPSLSKSPWAAQPERRLLPLAREPPWSPQVP